MFELGQNYGPVQNCDTCRKIIIPPGAIPNVLDYCRCLKVQSAATPMLKWALRELLGALPERRDWLNPDAERVLREAAK